MVIVHYNDSCQRVIKSYLHVYKYNMNQNICQIAMYQINCSFLPQILNFLVSRLKMAIDVIRYLGLTLKPPVPIRFVFRHYLSAHCISAFKHVKDKK